MDDLRELMREAELIEAPELWPEVERRAAGPGPPPPMRAGRRLATVAVAFAVSAAAAAFVWRAFLGDGSHPAPPARPTTTAPPPTSPPVSAADPLAGLPKGWTELAGPPEVRSETATAWTGSELLVWGGYVFSGSGDKPPHDTGFVFDPGSGTWSEMAPSPLSARASPASAWTGSELLVWGGYKDDSFTGSRSFLADGAAYDPQRTPGARCRPLRSTRGRHSRCGPGAS